MSDDTPKLSVQGTLAGIMEKTGGWHEIHVAMPGKQYPLRLATKLPALIELARAAGDNTMTWLYTEQDSGKENPNKPGTNYVNRYFSGVQPVGAASPPTPAVSTDMASSAVPAAGDAMTKDEWRAKDDAAHKRACIAIAVSALGPVDDRTPEGLNVYLERVAHLSGAWHRVVLAVRDDPAGEAIPFD